MQLSKLKQQSVSEEQTVELGNGNQRKLSIEQLENK